MPRRLSPPWTVTERAGCFRIDDAHGRRLAYVYFKEERLLAADHSALSKDEARRVAANIAKLPDLLSG